MLIQLLGGFGVTGAGSPVRLRTGGKGELLLATLALREGHRASREHLLAACWPQADQARAAQSLSTLLYSLHRLLASPLGGAAPVVHTAGAYRLNTDAGVAVDVARFDELVARGEQAARAGDGTGAVDCWRRAAVLYGGDLEGGDDVRAVVERERLRARHLTVLARLAHHHFHAGEHAEALGHALRLLAADPCREDAHRLVMRCHVRLGARAQALRQYRVCEAVLGHEFGAIPEPSTTALFDLVRLDPDQV